MAEFVGIIHTDNEPGYSVCFPDFPGCITAGDTLQETYSMAREALQFHIEGMLEDGEPLPKKTYTLDDTKKHPFARDAHTLFMLDVDVPTRPIRVNITMDENLLRRIDSTASNRSAFLAEAARRLLDQGMPGSIG
jgi:predicted RNase H-like HicB family nuclease